MQVRSIKQNYIFNTLLTVGNMIFPLISFPYVSRVLNPEGLGMVNYANSIIGYLTLISCLGVNTYGIKEGVKYRDNKELLSKFVSEMLIINLLACSASVVLLMIIYFAPGQESYRSLLLIYGLLIFITPFSISWFISVVEEYRFVTIRTLIIQVIGLICTFAFIKSKDDFVKYALINVGTSIITMVINLLFVRKYITIFSKRNYEIRKHIVPILFIFGSSLSATIYLNSDVTILGIIKGDYNVGIYSVSVKVVRILITFVASLSTVILPRVSYYYKKGLIEEYKTLVKKGIDFLLMFAIPMSLGLIIVAEPIVLLFGGSQYIDSIVNMRILAIDIVLSPLSGFISYQIVLPHNKERIFFISTTFSCILNIGLNLLLVPRFSENAAAFTTLLSELINIIICMVATRKEINYRKIFSELKDYVWGGAVMVCCLTGANLLLTNMYVKLFVDIGIGCIVYFLIIFLRKNTMFRYLVNLVKNK